MKWTLLRRSIVRDHVRHLPRPKIVQDVLLVGDKEECHQKLDEIFLNPENQSTDQIEVTLYVTKFTGQKSHTSQTYTKDNGKRNLGR